MSGAKQAGIVVYFDFSHFVAVEGARRSRRSSAAATAIHGRPTAAILRREGRAQALRAPTPPS